MAINVIKEEDNSKKKVKIRIPAEAVTAIIIIAFKASDIYRDNA